ncbi:uracil-xanthine permease family protein [Streptomyces fractus]|uniref:uracil-xanthine permease family protein n=1 Tax=Streptomyces fractus TaxID=641806 RepID=UPI003CF2914A
MSDIKPIDTDTDTDTVLYTDTDTDTAPGDVPQTPPAPDVEAKLPPGKTALVGLQQLLVSNVWLDPLFIAGVGGLSAGLSANLVAVTFLAAGLATLVQTWRLVRLPIVEGPSSAFDAMAIAAAKSGQLAAATTGLVIGAALVFLAAVTGVLGSVRRFFTPAVTGTVMLLVGLVLAQFTFLEFFGGEPSAPGFAAPATVLIAVVTCGAVYALGRGRTRPYAFLLALALGDGLAGVFGRLDFGVAADAAWFGLPSFLPYGPLTFDAGLTVTMTVIFLVAVIEAIGCYEATAEHTGRTLTSRRLGAGVAGEAGGSLVSGLFGGFGTTAYAQNLGVVQMTGVASRRAVRATALIMITLAFCPKIGAFLVATPAPVVGGLFLPAAAAVCLAGLRLIGKVLDDQRRLLFVALALMAGLGLPTLGRPFLDHLPSVLADLAGQGVVVGTVTVLALEILGGQRSSGPTTRSTSGGR